MFVSAHHRRIAAMIIMAALAPRAGAADQSSLDSLSLEDLMNIKVQTAALHPQDLSSAPGAVTVITSDQIRKYGYRTLGEALNHVRGFYQTYDYTYNSVGISGFSLPGDWGTRTLLLVNGHALPENIFGSANYFGEDFAVDMSLVERIEIVRGPSSALYGSNGILATINVITKTPEQERGTSARIETGTLGERKLTVTDSMKLPHGRSLLVSGTVLNFSGQRDIYISAYDTPDNNNGHAIRMDGQRGYRLFADFRSGNWEVLSVLGSRQKIQPVSFAETIFNDRGTRATDQRAFVDVQYKREKESGHSWVWRTYYDSYRFKGLYHYPMDSGDINVNREFDAGDWVGSRITDRFAFLRGHLTLGAEGKFDLRALQSTEDVQPVYMQNLYVNVRDISAAGFLQQEYELGRRWSLNLGLRYDWTKYRSNSVSPRAALVYKPNQGTSIKFLYGRGFRNPNANELFFDDGKQNAGNLGLRPERSDTAEIAVEQKLSRSWKVIVSGYRMLDKGVIVPLYNDDGLIQFQNADRFSGAGVGVELTGNLPKGLELATSFQKQKSYLGDRLTPANSPGNVGKIQMSSRVLTKKVVASAGLLYMSERLTFANSVLPAVYLPEATVSIKVSPHLDIQAGVRNLTNHRYDDPVGLASTVDTLRQPGRSFFLVLNPHTRE